MKKIIYNSTKGNGLRFEIGSEFIKGKKAWFVWILNYINTTKEPKAVLVDNFKRLKDARDFIGNYNNK